MGQAWRAFSNIKSQVPLGRTIFAPVSTTLVKHPSQYLGTRTCTSVTPPALHLGRYLVRILRLAAYDC